MSRTRLEEILFPKGKSSALPNVMPSVLDSDGLEVGYFSDVRKTTEATVVDIGDAPNSNTGDALRTAFIKMNNFMEAVYWWSDEINHKFNDLDSDVQHLQTALDNAAIDRNI
jgi:hypothetical protein